MNSRFDKAHILAQIAKLGAEIYGIIIEKKVEQANAERDHKIAELEAQIADLKRKAECHEE